MPIDALDLDDFLDVAKIRAMLPPQARYEPPLTEEQRIVQVLLTRLLSPAATFRPTLFPLDLPTERGLHRFATALTRVWPLGLDPGPPPPRLSAAQQRLWRFVVVQMRRIRDGLRIAIHALTQTFTDTEQSRRATRDALSREIRLLLGTQHDLNGELQFLVDPNAARALRDSQKEKGPVYEKEDLEELKSASEKNKTLKEVHKQAVSAAADRFFGFGYPRRFQRRRGSGFSPAGTRGRRFQSGQARKGRRNFRGRGNRIDDSNSNNRANSKLQQRQRQRQRQQQQQQEQRLLEEGWRLLPWTRGRTREGEVNGKEKEETVGRKEDRTEPAESETQEARANENDVESKINQRTGLANRRTSKHGNSCKRNKR